MARTIILVRHGKAEKAALGTEDIDRSLVEGAAAALAPTYRNAFALLGGVHQARLWVSPALRAKQTAAVVSPALVGNGVGIAESRELACLLHQDQGALLDELAATPEDACVVAVGHIPFMEDMLARLCGSAIDFAPGSVAAVELEGDPHAGAASASGRLLWFVRGPKLA